MVFKVGDYMHDRCMDVFIEVVKVQYQDELRAHLQVLWWNLGWMGECYVINPKPEVIEIRGDDYTSWRSLESRRRHVQELV